MEHRKQIDNNSNKLPLSQHYIGWSD